MEINTIIRNNIHEYLKQKGRLEVPPEEHVTVENSVPISYLGACPRNKALGRRNYAPIVPENRFEENLGALISTENGNMAESLIKGSLMYGKLAQHGDLGYSVSGCVNGANIHGRIDALIHYDGHPYVVEIKSSRSFFGKSPTPLLRYLYQLTSYLLLTDINQGILIYITNDIYQFNLVRMNEGFILENEDGSVAEVAYNHPETLCAQQIGLLAAAMKRHMDMDDDELLLQIPISDPLNDETSPSVGETWQCLKVDEKPHQYRAGNIKLGTVHSSCPWPCAPALQTSEPVTITIENGELKWLR
jgi:hypothetical protein